MTIKKLTALTEFKKQLIKFGLIGVLAVLTDLTAYYILLKILPNNLFVQDIYIAKTLSFLCGLVVTYNLNKRWTWRKTDKSKKRLVKFMFLYMASLVINVFSNALFVHILENYQLFEAIPNKYFVAFICATVLCSAFNFIGQKLWVFRESNSEDEEV
jgi:putative flippase GtrA